MAYSRKIHKIQKRKRQELEPSDSDEVVEEEGAIQDPNRALEAPTYKVRNFSDVDLWGSDLDMEENQPRIKRKPKKEVTKSKKEASKPNEEAGSSYSEEEDNQIKKNDSKKKGSKRRGRKIGSESEKAKFQRSFSDPESDFSGGDLEDESSLEKQLKPIFENPKWLGECVPFALTHANDGGDQDHVPAAINRYLKDYQQEGVQFLHSIVVRGLGAVLGDDMGELLLSVI